MKKLCFAVLLIAVLLSCKSTPASTPSDFDAVIGKEWKLIEVRINNSNTGYNRSSLARSGFANAFTVTFDATSLSGVGAPNRYSAPYSVGNGRVIIIGLVRSTMMAALQEPDRLREHDFFGYIQNAYRWTLNNNSLVLNSKTENGREVVLVFEL
jgi:heat shock protein HslJ